MINVGSRDSNKIPAYVSYHQGGGDTKRPGIIIIHEWYGLVPHIKDVADRYAAEGYVALAPDLYEGKVATNDEQAMKLSSSVSADASEKMIQSSLDYLSRSGLVAEGKVGITGFCFGGTHSFNFACESRDVAAGAIYYATRLPSDEKLKRISAPLLLIYGDKDRSVSTERARELENTLNKMGKDAQLLIYPGCQHAFFNDQNPRSYRPEASKDAWAKTLDFFRAKLS